MTHYKLNKDKTMFPASGKINVRPAERQVVIDRLHKEGYTFLFERKKTLYIVWLQRRYKHMNYISKSDFEEFGNPTYTMELFEQTAYPLHQTEDDWSEIFKDIWKHINNTDTKFSNIDIAELYLKQYYNPPTKKR